MWAVLAAVVSVILAGTAGYFWRRREHLREKRLDAHLEFLRAFVAAARASATLMSVHLSTGYPDQLNRTQWSEEQRREMTSMHQEAFSGAIASRETLEASLCGVDLVGGAKAPKSAETLVQWLTDEAYSVEPWKRGRGARLDPVVLERTALVKAREFALAAQSDLWGRSAKSGEKLAKL